MCVSIIIDRAVPRILIFLREFLLSMKISLLNTMAQGSNVNQLRPLQSCDKYSKKNGVLLSVTCVILMQGPC